ncbi:MAG: class I SAM-dependent methyltransferase [Blastocatellales bacterium]
MQESLQKQLAVETHTAQAELFASRYGGIDDDPYRDCFVYSRRRLNIWLDKFLPVSGAGLKLLDVGCGTGYHLARYRERGFDITGIDGSEGMLREARSANPQVKFHQGDVDSLPLPDASFDYALCIEVLRYLPNIAPCVREIARVLKPGGLALVTAAPPLQANAYWPVNRVAAAFKLGNLTALKQFFHSSGKLKREFEAAGFDRAEIHGVYGGPMIWVERVMPRVMPGLLRAWEKIDEKTADAPAFRHFSNMFLVCAAK